MRAFPKKQPYSNARHLAYLYKDKKDCEQFIRALLKRGYSLIQGRSIQNYLNSSRSNMIVVSNPEVFNEPDYAIGLDNKEYIEPSFYFFVTKITQIPFVR